MRVFRSLIRGMTIRDLGYLSHFDRLRSRLYYYDEALPRPRHPVTSDKISWITMWVLTRFSKKFIQRPSRLPSMEKLKRDRTNWFNRMKWDIAMKDEISTAP